MWMAYLRLKQSGKTDKKSGKWEETAVDAQVGHRLERSSCFGINTEGKWGGALLASKAHSYSWTGLTGLLHNTWFPRSHSFKPEEEGSQIKRVLCSSLISTFVLERKFNMPEEDGEYFGKNGNALFAWVFYFFYWFTAFFSVCINLRDVRWAWDYLLCL